MVSFAAGCGQSLFSLDFRHAFLQADVANPDLLIELPDLPFEMMTGEFGAGKRDAFGAPSGKAGRLKRAPYGLRDSPRLWARHLQRLLTKEVGVRILGADRNAFKCQVGVERRNLAGRMPRRRRPVFSVRARDSC